MATIQTQTPRGPNVESSDPARGAARCGLRIERLDHRFGELEVLQEIDLSVAPGETLAIVGHSGCGKSTLLELIAGLAQHRSGRIAVGEATEAADRLRHCAYMPQRDLLQPWLRAIDNAALALRLAGMRKAEAREAARPTLARLGLGDFCDARPSELSGGMRQRVAFARTLLSGKPVLLLDEPFASLDAITRADLQSWLRDALAEEPRTTVLVTHDVEEALYLGDWTMVLSPRPGRPVLAEQSPVDRSLTRTEAVSRPEFTAARERALAALAEGGVR